VEALSTTQFSNGEVGGFAIMDARQFSKNEAVFQLTMMMESILETSDVINPTIKSYFKVMKQTCLDC
jgi:hypothetical protein